MSLKVCGIILKVNDRVENLSELRILGRTCLEWVAVSLGESYKCAVDFNPSVEIPSLVHSAVDPDSDITVVLFCDTPLITRKTVLDAVTTLNRKGLNVLKMTRGYVFKTEFLLKTDKIYAPTFYYFDEEDMITALSYKQIALISDYLKQRINNFHMEQGVYIENPDSVYIDCDVIIGKNVRIGADCVLSGKTIIKDGVTILGGSRIDNGVIDEGALVDTSRLNYCYIGKNTTVGPYAYIRPQTVIGSECRIGDFVEIKKSKIGNNTKISHLAYVGDADVGSGCNIGCGAVVVNYDGKAKHKTTIGNDVFVGSNCNLIAPITLENGAFVAAGSTLTDSVPKNNLAIARARQINKADWKRK